MYLFRRKANATERKFDISETGSCPSTAMVISLSVELIIILSHKIRILIQALTLTLVEHQLQASGYIRDPSGCFIPIVYKTKGGEWHHLHKIRLEDVHQLI